MQRIGTATRYVATRKTGITNTERNLIQFAEDQLKSAVEKTNTFFNQNWNPYRVAIEGLDLSPFKETETFKLED